MDGYIGTSCKGCLVPGSGQNGHSSSGLYQLFACALCRVHAPQSAKDAGGLHRLVKHSCAADALAATQTSILAAGPDLKVRLLCSMPMTMSSLLTTSVLIVFCLQVHIYSQAGILLQAYDLSLKAAQLQQFNSAAACPVAAGFAVASMAGLHIFDAQSLPHGLVSFTTPDVHVSSWLYEHCALSYSLWDLHGCISMTQR